MERCLRELAAIEAELLAGNPHVEGLCLALSDWSMELRLIRLEQRKPPDRSPTTLLYMVSGRMAPARKTLRRLDLHLPNEQNRPLC